jgi:hypothetical protein
MKQSLIYLFIGSHVESNMMREGDQAGHCCTCCLLPRHTFFHYIWSTLVLRDGLQVFLARCGITSHI